MFKSDTGHGPLSGEPHDKLQHTQADSAFPHSLVSIPAGLEVVPTDHKQFQQPEKETVQELPEAISQAEKEASEIWAPSYGAPAPLHEGLAERRTCGLKRKVLWIVLVVLSLVIALALIIGLGAGLGLRKSRTSSSCDPCMCRRGLVVDIADISNSYPGHGKFCCQLAEERHLWRGQGRR